MIVHVVGNVTEDLIFSLPRLPKAGETLIADEHLVDMGGKGLNQAVLLSRTGCTVRFVAAVGSDDAGRRAHAHIRAELPESRLLTVDAPSDQSIISVASDGENHIVSSAGAADSLDAVAAVEAIGTVATDDAVVVQGNLTREATQAVLNAGRHAGAWTIANPSPIRWSWDDLLPLCDLVILNRRELVDLSASSPGTAADLLKRGAGAVLLTLGSDGAVHACADGEIAVHAVPVAVIDSAGAGDTFLAGFVGATLLGYDTAHALRAAAAASAITVSRPGTSSAFPSRDEMRACMAKEEAVH